MFADLGRGDSFPLHQVLHLAIKGDSPRQDFILLPASQPPCCSKVAADGALEVGELAVGVHAMNYVCRVKPGERAQHLCSCCVCVWVWVCMGGRRDLRVWRPKGPSWSSSFPFQGWSRNRYGAGCSARLAGATEA